MPSSGSVTTTNSTGVLGSMFTPIVNNGTVTIMPTKQQVVVGTSGYQGYNLTGHPESSLFKTYIKQLEGKVLICEEKIEKEEFVVHPDFAMRFVYQFLEQVPFTKTLDNLNTQPIDDEIHRVYWRKAKKDERRFAVLYDESEIDAFIEDAKEYMSNRYQHGSSGASGIVGASSFANSIMCSGVVGSGMTVDAQGNVHFSGNVTINGTLEVGGSADNASFDAPDNGDTMTWAGGGSIN